MNIRKKHIFKKPWGIQEGLLIGTGLLTAGLMLQFSIGNVRWHQTAWPVNILLLSAFMSILVGMHLLHEKVYFFTWLGGYANAISSLIFSTLVTLVLGITEQKSAENDGCMLNHLLSAWPFVLIYVWLTVSLGMTILKVSAKRWTKCTLAFMLNHLGLFVVLIAGTMGNADIRRLSMTVGNRQLGYDVQDIAHEETSSMLKSMVLDFAIALNDFEITYHTPDSAHPEPIPESYTSHVRIYTKTGDELTIWCDTVIRVNKPVNVQGWDIYQYGYGGITDDGTVGFSRLELVRDPWLPWVYTGILMMLGGALTLLLTKMPKNGKK